MRIIKHLSYYYEGDFTDMTKGLSDAIFGQAEMLQSSVKLNSVFDFGFFDWSVTDMSVIFFV